MKSVSDEALIDLDDYTVMLIAKRKRKRCDLRWTPSKNASPATDRSRSV
jgi:hypothetical protein